MLINFHYFLGRKYVITEDRTGVYVFALFFIRAVELTR